MAVVILGGLATSTLLNLFVVPALYLRFGKGKAERSRQERPGPSTPPDRPGSTNPIPSPRSETSPTTKPKDSHIEPEPDRKLSSSVVGPAEFR
jgi:hypothetical protein